MHVIVALKKGNHDIFISVLKSRHTHVFRFFYKKTGDVEAAKELTQQCFIRLWEYRQSLSESYTFERQLFAIAKSVLSNYLKKEKTFSDFKIRFTAKQDEETPADHYFEQQDFIHTAFEQLTPIQRQILNLKFVDGLTNKEISHQLSLSIKTVEWHISNAYGYLRKLVHSI
ncbi:RNA polymerase sigma factor [Asinibacterium sp. OR53]|uniref:RNA polymerase sigma factor n=1 Tax=Asinibacterium sp. OR53 TaxID=925409 RepID=UPI0003F59837|nr:sigma-70 family RNA polymerase sigma factor [Asinibacterium sp. OR53]